MGGTDTVLAGIYYLAVVIDYWLECLQLDMVITYWLKD